MTRLFTRTTAILAFLASVMIMNLAQAAEPVSKSRRGVAIGGHDSVAYHSIDRDPQADAIEGSKTYVVEYKGAKWRFGSKESADLFEADPERYSPAYNGHCANALSLGKGLVRTNGETWEIRGQVVSVLRSAWSNTLAGWKLGDLQDRFRCGLGEVVEKVGVG